MLFSPFLRQRKRTKMKSFDQFINEEKAPFEPTAVKSTPYKNPKTKAKQLARKAMKSMQADAQRKMKLHKDIKEESEVNEVLTPKTSMGTYIKDFEKSSAPQFKGKSPAKRRQMAIAAKLEAMRSRK
jgi:hypothetical protein